MINKKLQRKILAMSARDQKLRKQAMEDLEDRKWAKRVYNCDTKNILEAKKIVKKHGWPTFELVGKKASSAFWLIVQHADRDLKFQKKCLKYLEKAANNNQAHPQNIAFLTDRIVIAEGRKQKFGTQFIFKKNKLVLKPVTDKKNLNKRRLKCGLNTIEERVKEINKK